VAVAGIVGIVVLAAEVDGREGHRARLLDVELAFARRAAFDDLSAPAEPQAAGGLQHLAQRDGEPAGRRLSGIGNPVRDDHQATHRHAPQITVSQAADSRTAPSTIPAIEYVCGELR